MAREAWLFESNMILSCWPEVGGCGEIWDADRIHASFPLDLAKVLSERVAREINNCWPAGLTFDEYQRLPVKLSFNIVIERKGVRIYGK